MAYIEEKVYHLEEYIGYITDIGMARRTGENTPPLLWSRGHRQQDWSLKPTLLRNVDLNDMKIAIGTATGRAMEEEMRKQHYIAKNYHFLGKEPQTNLDWMQVMQHHGVKTRVLDWSESVMHSLIFSLECFFDKDQENERMQSSPCIWILEPVEWNMKTLEGILESDSIIDFCADSLPRNHGRTAEVKARMKELKKYLNDYMKLDTAMHLKGIFNLSSVANELKRLRSDDLMYLLEKGEYYYCLFYILNYVYLSSNLCKISQVMPLSIVEAYHCDRIRAQKGAFSIFPYYEEDTAFKNCNVMGVGLDAMENMHKGNCYLHKIILCNQDEIAFEVMNMGANISWLYQEMPVVANAIENRKIFV